MIQGVIVRPLAVEDIADFHHRALEDREGAAAVAKIREEVHAFSRKFPLPF